jgi:hypothetical protein
MPIYQVKIFKSWGGRDPDRRWCNNYELDDAGATPADVVPAVNTIVAAEKLIHTVAIGFLSATISTWQPDSVPYDPTSFTTIELSGAGVRAAATGVQLDSNVCFVVRYSAALGRNGRRFYRGVLNEEDVQTGGDGKWSLIPTSTLYQGQANFNAFAAGLATLLGNGTLMPGLKLVGGGEAPLVRDVINVISAGVTVNRRNHRYFDRAA